MRRRAWAAMLATMVAVALLSGAAPARANGVPQLVKLSYLDGVSTWGPKDGEGVLQFSFAEAYARLEVKNLKPVDGFSYEGWLLAPGGQTFRVGAFTVQPDGVGAMETKLAGLDRYDYNLFLVAGRAAGAKDSAALPPQKSIAGRFSIIADPKTGQTSADVRPDSLPDTGQQPAGLPWGRILTTGATMAGTALMLVGFKLRRQRKEQRG